MRDLIFKYLQTHYNLSLNTYQRHELYDKFNKKYKRIHKIFLEMKDIFDIEGEIFMEVVDEWLTLKNTELNAELIHIQERLIILTGKDIIISTTDLDEMTSEHDKFIEYIKKVVHVDDDIDYDDEDEYGDYDDVDRYAEGLDDDVPPLDPNPFGLNMFDMEPMPMLPLGLLNRIRGRR